MRDLLLIVAKDLKLRLRDRSVIIVGLIAPAALAVIFSLVFGDALSPTTGFTAAYGVVDLDGTEASAGLGQALENLDQASFEVLEFASVADAEAAIDDDGLTAAFVVPAGFEAGIGAGGAEIEVIGNVDAPTGTGIATAIATAYASSVDRVAATVGAALAVGAPPAEIPSIIEAAASQQPPAVLGSITAEFRQMDAPTFVMAGMAVFFLFFTVQLGVASILEERRQGTWDRLLVSGVGQGVAIGAKALVSFLLGLVSMAVLMIGATIGLGASWGDPLAVSLLVIGGVAAATGVMALVAAGAKTVEGAANLQSIIAVALGMLGGSFFPIGTDGGVLALLSRLTPHWWFLRGLNDLSGSGGVGFIIPSLIAMAVFAVVTGGAAAWLFARKERA